MSRPPKPPERPVLDSVLAALELFVRRSSRIPVLLAIAYVAGFSGVGLSVYGGGDPEAGLTAAGIVLMAVSFVCMFVAAVTFQQLANLKRDRS